VSGRAGAACSAALGHGCATQARVGLARCGLSMSPEVDYWNWSCSVQAEHSSGYWPRAPGTGWK